MMRLLFLLVTAVHAGKTLLHMKLPLLIASVKARLSKTVPHLQDTLSQATDILKSLPFGIHADPTVFIHDAEELCSGVITEMFLLVSHRDRFKSGKLDSQISDCHRRLQDAFDMYETAIDAVGKEKLSNDQTLDELRRDIIKVRLPLSDIKKLLKGQRLQQAINESLRALQSIFSRMDSFTVILAEQSAPSLQRTDSIIDDTQALLAALRKIMILQFQAEMQHVKVLRKSRGSPKAEAGKAMERISGIVEFKKSFANGVIFGRRLDLLIEEVANSVDVIKMMFEVRGAQSGSTLNLAELWASELCLATQKAYIGLLVVKVPDSFPVAPSRSRLELESKAIQEFIERFIAISIAEESLSTLRS